jgi:hypothetical protein
LAGIGHSWRGKQFSSFPMYASAPESSSRGVGTPAIRGVDDARQRPHQRSCSVSLYGVRPSGPAKDPSPVPRAPAGRGPPGARGVNQHAPAPTGAPRPAAFESDWSSYAGPAELIPNTPMIATKSRFRPRVLICNRLYGSVPSWVSPCPDPCFSMRTRAGNPQPGGGPGKIRGQADSARLLLMQRSIVAFAFGRQALDRAVALQFFQVLDGFVFVHAEPAGDVGD